MHMHKGIFNWVRIFIRQTADFKVHIASTKKSLGRKSHEYFFGITKFARIPILQHLAMVVSSECPIHFSQLPKVMLVNWLLERKTAAAVSLQSCPTLCDPIDSSPPGSPVPGILQARTLEWVAISFSNAWKWKVKVKLLSCVRLFATPVTAAHQGPPSLGFSRQEHWSGLPFPSPMHESEKWKWSHSVVSDS